MNTPKTSHSKLKQGCDVGFPCYSFSILNLKKDYVLNIDQYFECRRFQPSGIFTQKDLKANNGNDFYLKPKITATDSD